MAAKQSALDRLNRGLATPEFNVALFALLLNYPWEFLQVPFFAEMLIMAHWETC